MTRLAALAAVVLLVASACGREAARRTAAAGWSRLRDASGSLQIDVSDSGRDRRVRRRPGHRSNWTRPTAGRASRGTRDSATAATVKARPVNPPPGNKVSAFLGCDTIVLRQSEAPTGSLHSRPTRRTSCTPNGVRPGMASGHRGPSRASDAARPVECDRGSGASLPPTSSSVGGSTSGAGRFVYLLSCSRAATIRSASSSR